MAELNQRQRARLEKAERFLRTARQALRDGDYESCVSRGYYAVFHAIHALLDREESIRSHVELIRRSVEWNRTYTQLERVGNLEGNDRLESSLRKLHRWRNDADYAVGLTTRDRAQRALSFSEQFQTAVKEAVA